MLFALNKTSLRLTQDNAVLGMDFLVRHNPLLSFQKRTMTFAFDTRWGHRKVALQAVASDPCADHELKSDTFELCSFDVLSNFIKREVSDAYVECICCLHCTHAARD